MTVGHLHDFTAHHTSLLRRSHPIKIPHPQPSGERRTFLDSISGVPVSDLPTSYANRTNMPNNIPEFQIANFLTTNTRPLSLSDPSLKDNTDTDCSICHIAYANPPQNYVHPDLPDGEKEYAVEIQNRGTCKHIFGRRCLEQHIRSGNPWSHTCPLCRTEWFSAPNSGRREILMDVERTLTALAALDLIDGRTGRARQELARVEVALVRIREALYESRWI